MVSMPMTHANPDKPPILVTDWTASYQHYGQPHAIWLSQYSEVGINLPKLKYTIKMARKRQQQPEIVIYSIPERDMGQSSAGGFKTSEDYLEENQLIAKAIQKFVKKTKIPPRVYLEPDTIGHSLTLLKEAKTPDEHYKARTLYLPRVQLLRQLVALYKNVGALVYLDAAHSGWFDYGDADIESMAQMLKECDVAKAHGVVFNVSNRQKVGDGKTPQTEARYARRLLKALKSLGVNNMDVIVDTSRNGGKTHQRVYHLKTNGIITDNQFGNATDKNARQIGQWEKQGELLQVKAITGREREIAELVEKDYYHWDEEKRLLLAPPWLDPVGDVQPGEAPTDKPVVDVVNHYRWIKPPDDCDGALHCPPGESKFSVNQKLNSN